MSNEINVDSRIVTYSNNLSPDKRESSVVQNRPPAKETAFSSCDIIILDEWSRILPITESNAVMVGTASQINDDAKNDKPGDCDDFDGSNNIKNSEL